MLSAQTAVPRAKKSVTVCIDHRVLDSSGLPELVFGTLLHFWNFSGFLELLLGSSGCVDSVFGRRASAVPDLRACLSCVGRICTKVPL